MTIKYIAYNGREFDSQENCEKYEAELEANTVWVVYWEEKGMGECHGISGVFSTKETAESYVSKQGDYYYYNIQNYVLNEPD